MKQLACAVALFIAPIFISFSAAALVITNTPSDTPTNTPADTPTVTPTPCPGACPTPTAVVCSPTTVAVEPQHLNGHPGVVLDVPVVVDRMSGS